MLSNRDRISFIENHTFQNFTIYYFEPNDIVELVEHGSQSKLKNLVYKWKIDLQINSIPEFLDKIRQKNCVKLF